ncbi:MAG: Lysine--tRNA ligase [Candidatus Saccharibacteria bacterium]|nr:Lysine--tRNA ligase [Candidatus Saccharibacteria bacterium]
MQWLNAVVDSLIARHPDGEILIESGGSPSGTYHFGHMRELVTADAIMLEVRRRGRKARHIYFVDDLDAFRKVPVNVSPDFEQYLGLPLCDVPAPDGSNKSYADFFLDGMIKACAALSIEVEFIRSHTKYRSGWFVPAIERVLTRVPQARKTLEEVSGRKLDDHWTPIQVMDRGRLKNRTFVSMDTDAKTVQYRDVEGSLQIAGYDRGEVKLDWRLDWPARWWLQEVLCEPSGQDHVTKGSSYDTGVHLMKDIFEAEAPISVPYEFINMVGDNKKMSASKGTGLDAIEGAKIMPPEVLRYFILRSPPSKRLYFDPVNSVIQTIDEFAALAAKTDRTPSEDQLLAIATRGIEQKTVSRVPFSLLVASYQAALKDTARTLEIIRRTEYASVVDADAEIIANELSYIEAWLEQRAPEDARFAPSDTVDPTQFNDVQKQFMADLAAKITDAPTDADGSWFHNAIYEFKDSTGMAPKELFATLYQALIGKQSGPRAGWFLSILPRDWLITRLKLEA